LSIFARKQTLYRRRTATLYITLPALLRIAVMESKLFTVSEKICPTHLQKAILAAATTTTKTSRAQNSALHDPPSAQ
jgi:hypothetical protein